MNINDINPTDIGLMAPGINYGDWAIILLVVATLICVGLLLFKKVLPEAAKYSGRLVRSFKEEMNK